MKHQQKKRDGDEAEEQRLGVMPFAGSFTRTVIKKHSETG
jgi:hypothetical protein